MRTETLLREQIEKDLNELGKIQVGTEQYKSGADGLAKLISQLTELERLKVEEANSQDKLLVEEKLRITELEIDKKDRRIRNGLTLLSIGSSGLLLVWGTLTNWKYESKGYIPSTNPGRMFVNGFNSLLKRK